MPIKKSTKKFEKNHLKDTLGRRKEFSKVKQKHQIKAKRQERNAKDNARAADVEEEEAAKKAKKNHDGSKFADMSVDDFFQGGFEVPEMPKQKGKKSAAKANGAATTTGKRKRITSEEDDAQGEDSGSGSGSEDFGAHKGDLAALQSKDPEFYKYLQENDAELLDFDEDADLAEIDALSEDDDEATPRKKQKKGTDGEESNEVTKAMVKKWNTAMSENHSLRATREVVLAFRAASHLNEEDGKEYKYSISDSEGRVSACVIRASPNTLQSTTIYSSLLSTMSRK
jgi:nucleolar complex protein 2